MLAKLFVVLYWLCTTLVVGQYTNCDYFQQMKLDTEYFVYSRDYPKYYAPSTACRWYAEAPINSKITLTCTDILIPLSTNCHLDRLVVSTNGSVDLMGAQRYCGNGTLTVTSQRNLMNIVLISMNNSPGGRFLCTMKATQKPAQCNCGWKKKTRIVGGSPTAANEYPPMAGLRDFRQGNVFCGATIISNRYLVTAAHCVANRPINDFEVLVGYDHLQTTTQYSAKHRVDLIRVHERFDTSTYQNDIALVRTRTLIVFSNEVGPVCLPYRYRGSNFAGVNVTALGWGTTGFGSAPSDKLLKVRLSIQSNENCIKHYGNRLTTNQVCTYGDAKDTCQNDSGGPLCFESYSGNRIYLVGIVSYSIMGCGTKIPGVNTRVTSYIDWIQSNSPDASYCVI